MRPYTVHVMTRRRGSLGVFSVRPFTVYATSTAHARDAWFAEFSEHWESNYIQSVNLYQGVE